MALTHQKKYGQYFTTNADLKQKVFDFILNQPSVILEPSIGRGDLVAYVQERIPFAHFDMYEIDTTIDFLATINREKIHFGDFLLTREFSQTSYKTIIGNPPYIRTQKSKKNQYIRFIEKCFDLFRKVINTKKYNLVEIQPKDNYNILSEFYMVKKNINNLDSPYFIKYDCLFGPRLHKTLVFKKIPESSIYLKDYTIKEDYAILRDQLLISIELLKNKGLCCDLDKIVVYKNEIASILFNDYSSLKKGKFSETQLKQLLEKLTT
jgi:hypothetical protein